MSVSITIPSQSVTIPSQVISVPVVGIAYQNSWLSQTSSISGSSIFTVTQPGIFRISGAVYCFNKPPDPLPDATCSVHCTLTVDSQDVDVSFACTSQYGEASALSATDAIVVGDGTSVILNASITDQYGVLDHYDLYVTVEQLQ